MLADAAEGVAKILDEQAMLLRSAGSAKFDDTEGIYEKERRKI